MTNIIIWNEFLHEVENEDVKKLYPNGIHGCIKEFLSNDSDLDISTATLKEEKNGITEEKLSNCDVLIWWGHKAHNEVLEETVNLVQRRVLEGMGLLVLHSGHHSKIFKRLMGTNCNLTWREYGEKERLWICNPGHPICEGLDPYFELEMEEMYGEPFQVPSPDETLFTSWFEGGETFRSGLLYKRGNGKIFYFRPGHEAYPTYFDKNVQRVIINAVKYLKPSKQIWEDIHSPTPKSNRPKPIESISKKGFSVGHPTEE